MKTLQAMPRFVRLLTGAALATALGGCAHYQWFKPDATQADYDKAIYDCNMEAARAYPAIPTIQPVSPGYIAPGYVRCGYFGCYSMPGYYIPPAMGLVDVNQGNRDQATSQCMMANGWQLIKVKN